MSVRPRSLLGIIPALSLLCACAVSPDPFTEAEREARIEADRAIIAEMAPVPDSPIDLYDAMARALAFNLKHRQHLLETAIAAGVSDVGAFDMLPDLAASAGLSRRNNDYATISRDLSTGVTDDSYSTSVDRTRRTGDLELSWSVLDFGVSYLQAHQNADRVLIADEKRRKAVQTILRDVQSAWLRAVVAERLTRDLTPLIARIERTVESARIIEDLRLVSPMESLRAQRELLDILRTLHGMRRELVGARADLARLINIPPGAPFKLAMPAALDATPVIRTDLSDLIERALRNRPELREEDYQARISADETRKAMLRMLPGLELSIGAHWDDNSYLQNATWADAGMFLAWNLMALVSGPAKIALAEQREEATHLRRLALHMAVAAQVAVAWEHVRIARDALDIADTIHEVDQRIYEQTLAGAETDVQTEYQLIRSEAARLASRIRREMAYVEREEAVATLRVSLGDDPLDAVDALIDQEAEGPALTEALRDWHRILYAEPAPLSGIEEEPPSEAPASVEWTIEATGDL